MTEITQADRDAAAKAWAEDNDEPLDCHICEQIRAGYGDNSLDVIRFARHRMEERAAIVAWLRETSDIFHDEISVSRKRDTSELLHHAQSCSRAAKAIEEGEHWK